MMDAAAILSLISDLYSQIAEWTHRCEGLSSENAMLHKKLIDLQSQKDDSNVETVS